VIFATGASQLGTMEAPSRFDHLPWGQVHGFNPDDYVGLPTDHPVYLRDKLPERAQMKSFLEVDGAAAAVDKVCRDNTERLRAANPQLCLLGIGENGHPAFDDPAEANFNDLFDARIVHPDKMCRQQQAAEGWFKTYEDAPNLGVTLRIPALVRIPKLIISVSGKRKAYVVRRTVQDPIQTGCPLHHTSYSP
jgi:glucosamine-6-phosphate deaminase